MLLAFGINAFGHIDFVVLLFVVFTESVRMSIFDLELSFDVVFMFLTVPCCWLHFASMCAHSGYSTRLCPVGVDERGVLSCTQRCYNTFSFECVFFHL